MRDDTASAFSLPKAQGNLWRSKRDIGIARSARHAEAIDPEWLKTAYAMLGAYCAQYQGRSFTSEAFRKWCNARGFEIPIPKGLGSIFKKAATNGIIIRCGFDIAKDRHGSPCPLWKAM